MIAQPVDVVAVMAAYAEQHGNPEDLDAACVAVATLIATSDRTARHLEMAVEFIEKSYPEASHLERGPILNSMRRWGRNLRTAVAFAGGAD